MKALINATAIAGTVTFMPNPEGVEICNFLNVLDAEDRRLYNCDRNMTTPKKVMDLEETALSYSPNNRGDAEFEISEDSTHFHFKYSSIWDVQKVPEGMGYIVLIPDYLLGFLGEIWDLGFTRNK